MKQNEIELLAINVEDLIKMKDKFIKNSSF